MSESIFEHTTSIAGLTCKPLAILSETISQKEMNKARGGGGNGRIKMPGDGKIDDGITGMDEQDCPTYDCYPEGGHFDTEGKTFTQVVGPDVVEDPFGPILGGSGGGGGGGSSESDNTNDDEGHLGDFWNFDFSDDGTEDDGTEDECTVPYDCGDEENDEGNNDEGSGLPDEENSTEGNNG